MLSVRNKVGNYKKRSTRHIKYYGLDKTTGMERNEFSIT